MEQGSEQDAMEMKTIRRSSVKGDFDIPQKKKKKRPKFWKTQAFWIAAEDDLYGTSFATNKVAEAFFGIFALYVLIEFGNFEKACDMASYSKCAGEYISDSGEVESEFWFQDCGALVNDCEINPFILHSVRSRKQLYKGGAGSGKDVFDIPDAPSDLDDAQDLANLNAIELDYFGIRVFQVNNTSPYSNDGTEVCELTKLAEAENPDSYDARRCMRLGVDDSTCRTSIEGSLVCDNVAEPCFTDEELENCNIVQNDVSDTILNSLLADNNGELNPKASLPKLNMCTCFEKQKEFVVVNKDCEIVAKLYLLLLFGVSGIVLLEMSSGTPVEDTEDVYGDAETFVPFHMSVLRVCVLMLNIAYFTWLYISFVLNACDAPEFVNARQSTEVMAITSLALTVITVTVETVAMLGKFLSARCCKKEEEDEDPLKRTSMS